MVSPCVQSCSEDLFPYISREVRARSLYIASPCMKSWPGRFVSIYVTRWSNTKLEHVKTLAVDDYFDPKIIIFDQVFIASLLFFFFWRLFMVIRSSSWSIYLIIRRRKAWESLGEIEWAECFLWVYGFKFILWWVVSHTVFYKPCWWEYMFKWTS